MPPDGRTPLECWWPSASAKWVSVPPTSSASPITPRLIALIHWGYKHDNIITTFNKAPLYTQNDLADKTENANNATNKPIFATQYNSNTKYICITFTAINTGPIPKLKQTLKPVITVHHSLPCLNKFFTLSLKKMLSLNAITSLTLAFCACFLSISATLIRASCHHAACVAIIDKNIGISREFGTFYIEINWKIFIFLC